MEQEDRNTGKAHLKPIDGGKDRPRPQSKSEDLEQAVFTAKSDSYALVPDGVYTVVYLRMEKKRLFGGEKLFVWFRVCDEGPYFGVEIFKALNFYWPPKPRSDLMKDLEFLSGHRTKKGARIPLGAYKGKVLKVATETVKADYKQNPLPPFQWYSRIDRFIKVEVK